MHIKTTMLSSVEFRDNEKKSRFELLLNDSVAYVEYVRKENHIILFKTEIPRTISKINDSASYFMSCIVDFCDQNKTQLDIRCPFAKAVIRKTGV